MSLKNEESTQAMKISTLNKAEKFKEQKMLQQEEKQAL